MADRAVILPLLLALSAANAAGAVWLIWLLLRRLAPAAAHLLHTAPESAAAYVLAVSIAAGPVDAHPDTYAARTAALPLYSDPTTTTPGGTHA